MDFFFTSIPSVNTPPNPCPIEGGNNRSQCRYQPREGSIRDFPHVGLKECLRCGVVKHAENLQSYVDYERSSMHNWKTEFFSGTDAPKPHDVDRRLELIKTYLPSGSSICDIGSGFGEMAQALSQFFATSGIEPEVKALEDSISKGLQVYESVNKAQEFGLKFDALTIFHVIEHITNPQKFLRDLKLILKPNGLVFFETPNANDVLLTRYELSSFQSFTYWSHHPILYTKSALTELLNLNGFVVLENSGTQRYKLGNHLYWMAKGKPGGHLQWGDFEESQASKLYSEHLIEKEINDTLFFIARSA